MTRARRKTAHTHATRAEVFFDGLEWLDTEGGGMMEAYQDETHPGNGPKYHTGKPCLTPGCKNPAGTMWGKYWCFECNVTRMDRISDGFCACREKLDRER